MKLASALLQVVFWASAAAFLYRTFSRMNRPK
jgi:hypothetical protein